MRFARFLTVVTAALWIAFWVLRQWCLTTTEPFGDSVPYLDDGTAYQVTRLEWDALAATSIAGAVAFVVTLLVWAISVATRRKRRFRRR